MNKTVLAISILTLGLMATDFSSMTNDELISLRGTVAIEDIDDYRAEMQSRMDILRPQQQTSSNSQRGNNSIPVEFSDIDIDGDGQITEGELYIFREDRQAERADEGRLLKNIDNNIPSFETIDINGDEVIDTTEFELYQLNNTKASSQKSRGNSGQKLRDGSGLGNGSSHGRQNR